MNVRASLLLLMLVCSPSTAASNPQDPATQGTQPDPPPDSTPSLTWHGERIYFGLDLSLASVQDESLRESMGREHQVKLAFAIFTAYGDLGDHISYRIEANPVDDDVVPRPYIPSLEDRRTYFFPNQPDFPGSRGVSSDPEGLYKVDDYQHTGLDPIIQQGALRVGWVDIHDAARRFGIRGGRFYVNQGMGVNDLVWFTAKDLTHMQRVNFQADNGLLLYYDTGRIRAEVSAITGNANPYHDYGYFDFTDPSEDKNSALGAVGALRATFGRSFAGVSYRKNFINSKIEDTASIQLSKHTDDALVVFGRWEPKEFVRVFGEYAHYTWGVTPSSAEILPGPPIKTPVPKPGFYIGTDLFAPRTGWARLGLTIMHERISRDDALVAWAAAHSLFGVTLGETQTSTIVKAHANLLEHVTAFFFYNDLSNPFPELSAIKAISGPGSDRVVENYKYGLGLRFTF
jgi:hypothetical protein